MKIFVRLVFLLNFSCSTGQEIVVEKNYFTRAASEFNVERQSFTLQNFKFSKQTLEQSLLAIDSKRSTNLNLNIQFEKINMKPLEEKMNFNDLLLCGPMESRNSKDFMLSAIKHYILNKYVLSLFVNTKYD